ncbi:MAG TPA: bifunctional proline dehydrogenase/L-glutamate gamma-semialdehyde dehydrogenase PutA, partial [Dongiaceae bacterium]|nr:bifunctional proline dehydrogenase/L-glutamate gamma-semialdehyde dehydrogenase PutA [Dongiaceae bacterium]
RQTVGQVINATADQVSDAVGRAQRAFEDWSMTPANERAASLERAANLLEGAQADVLALCIREAGKTIPDAIAELREAVDFLRYYAVRARADFARPMPLPGPTGERNQIQLHGRGVFACISPWNFPLAIFLGQVSAALAAGNSVVAKPAEQTPMIAALAVRLLHKAGIPADVLHLVPGDGPSVGAPLVNDPRIAGVAFTGSTDTARAINRALAAKNGAIGPLIAETGGQNVMIVDSSALPEQVVRDVLISSFQSAGQRCSALRVMFVQEDIAAKLTEMLAGAMAELKVGDPALLATDVGPVIDLDARKMLTEHAQRMKREAELIYEVPLAPEHAHGHFFAPVAFRIDGLPQLEREVFGPVLHLVHYSADRLDDVLDAVNATGYGLTLGVHSRIDGKVRHIVERLRVGNAYVNRNMIGAVVGVQPFGGEGLSGTGPKAGGPRYLHRFATERTLTIDTTAAGGNASLLSLNEESAA